MAIGEPRFIFIFAACILAATQSPRAAQAWETHPMPRRAKPNDDLNRLQPAQEIPQPPDKFVWVTEMPPRESNAGVVPAFEIGASGYLAAVGTTPAGQTIEVDQVRMQNGTFYYTAKTEIAVTRSIPQTQKPLKHKETWLSGRYLKITARK